MSRFPLLKINLRYLGIFANSKDIIIMIVTMLVKKLVSN